MTKIEMLVLKHYFCCVNFTLYTLKSIVKMQDFLLAIPNLLVLINYYFILRFE